VFDDLKDLTVHPEKYTSEEDKVAITNKRIRLPYHGSRDAALSTLHKKNGQMEKLIFDIRYYRSLVTPRTKD